MKLPSKESTFLFDYVGQETGKEYQGSFIVKRKLTVAEKYKLEQDKSRLLGAHANPTAELSGYALLLSSLQNQIVEGPDWWRAAKGADFEDEDVLLELYSKIKEEEGKWRDEVFPKQKDELGK